MLQCQTLPQNGLFIFSQNFEKEREEQKTV